MIAKPDGFAPVWDFSDNSVSLILFPRRVSRRGLCGEEKRRLKIKII